MKKFLVRYHLLLVFYVIIGFLYVRLLYTHKRIYEKYHSMPGVVVSVTKAEQSGRYFPTIRLEDGTTQVVNNGYSPVKVGDTWYNHLGYHPLLGISGTAYGIYPGDGNFFSLAVHVILLILAYGPPIIVAIVAGPWMLVKWSKYVNRKLGVT